MVAIVIAAGVTAWSTQELEVPVPPWLMGQTLAPTYSEGAGLIFQHRCAGCHRPDGRGPMDFRSYDEIRKWSTQTQTPMIDAITLQLMPPWPADPSVGQFANDMRLSRVELNLLEQWIESAYPEGQGEYEPEFDWFNEWNIGEPDAVFELPEHTLASDIEAEVVEFTVQTSFAEDRWVVAAEALPGDGSVVVAIDAGPLGAYQATNSWTRHQPGTAKRLEAGASVRVRIHYKKSAGFERSDHSRLGVRFAADPALVEHELLDAPMMAEPFTLAARQEDLEVAVSFEFPADGLIHSLMPVMHTRGMSVQYTATFPDGRSQRLLWIPVWEPKWKHRYQLQTPIPAPAGTAVTAVAHFNNAMSNIRNPDPWSDVEFGPNGETFEGWLRYSLVDNR